MRISSLYLSLTLALLGATLAACGGGDGGGSATPPPPPPPPTPTIANAQGFWSTTVSSGGSASAVILPNGQAWVIYQNGSTVSALAQTTLALNGSTYSGSGKYFLLPGGAAQNYLMSGTIGNAKASMSNSVTIGAGAAVNQSWTYNSSYEAAATQASIQGSWSGAQDSIVLSWAIAADGTLSGSSNAGCSYSGSIKPNASPVAVFDVAVIELCAGTSRTLTGIATLNAAKTGMALAYTTGSGGQLQGGTAVLAK